MRLQIEYVLTGTNCGYTTEVQLRNDIPNELGGYCNADTIT
jgi:hypothetical protein